MPDIKFDEKPQTGDGVVGYWMKEITDAYKREKNFRKDAKMCVDLYEAKDRETSPYNILYSNTVTIQPALYNSVPRPLVTRRFKDADPVAGAAAKVCQRLLEYLLDPGIGTAESFDGTLKAAVLSSLVPGRGTTRYKYEAVTSAAAEGEESVDSEMVAGEHVHWDRILFGYAKRWTDLPWLAFIHFMTKAEVEDNFPDAAADMVYGGAVVDEDGNEEAKGNVDAGIPQLACIYEIWDKDSKKVIFISSGYKEGALREVDDPLNLTGFFPIPEPLRLVDTVSSMVPVPLYAFYEEQAKELNIISVRITRIVRALKVRGFYDASLEELGTLLEKGDNEMVPLANAAQYTQNNQGLEKVLFMLPIEKLVSVLQQLYLQRQQIKEVIYELTGIADIMRGNTQASETLGAQQIKSRWGGMRLKVGQESVANYARSSLRLMAELAVSKFSAETVKQITGLPYPLEAEKMQAQQQLQQMQMQVQQQMQMAQAMGQPPQQPPEPPPELVALVNTPSMEQLLAVLKADALRSYTIDIETNSTVAADDAEDKQNINELMNAMGQFFNSIGPLVESGVMEFDVAAAMLRAIARRYSFGPEVEEMLEQLGKKPKGPTQADQAAQAAQAQEQVKAQAEQQKAQMAMEALQQKRDHELEKMQMSMQALQQKYDVEASKLQVELMKTQQDAERAAAIHAQKMQEVEAKLAVIQANTEAAIMKAQGQIAVNNSRDVTME